MAKEEKVEYILEQVRLCLEKGDYVRGTIVSKKLTAKTFKDDVLQELKIRYYELLNRISNEKDDEYLEIAQNHFAIFQTPIVQEKTESWTGVDPCMRVARAHQCPCLCVPLSAPVVCMHADRSVRANSQS